MPRTPKPITPPTTLAEAVLDLERRMTGGDALSEVLLPAEDWTQLVELAEDADLPSAELVELRRFREDVREFLAMAPEATCLDLMNGVSLMRTERFSTAKVDPLPPKRQRKARAKAEEPEEPDEPQHRMRIEDVEEDAA